MVHTVFIDILWFVIYRYIVFDVIKQNARNLNKIIQRPLFQI